MDKHSNDRHEKEADRSMAYLCTGYGGFGIGHTPRSALSKAEGNGLDMERHDWAVWENLVPGGRFRLDARRRGVMVELPADMDEDDFSFWTHPNRPQRLRMIACGSHFANRIIKIRSRRIDGAVKETSGLNLDAVMNEAFRLLGLQ